GWNLENGIRREEAELRLKNDLWDAFHAAALNVPCFRQLDDVRQEVIVSMAFNLGIAGLMRFRKMLAALDDGEYGLAADEMLDSRWADQVGRRAQRLARQMRSGEAL
ncbi:MAG: glycoside hydrolase family protein, partial [Candidatus Omnitrophota bacterium]|nr:glycoside hydrolase family protein [Candidatus Omnitrophota bacterium]